MASPLYLVQYVVNRKSDGAQIIAGFTDVSGNLNIDFIEPGEYTVTITLPSGHSLDKSTLTEPGQSPVESTSLVIDNVTIVEGQTTTIVSNFLVN